MRWTAKSSIPSWSSEAPDCRWPPFYPEADEAAYEALLKQLTEAYGEPDQTIDNSGEALGGTISTRGAQWVADGTRLQLMWMNGEKIEPSFSLILGYGK